MASYSHALGGISRYKWKWIPRDMNNNGQPDYDLFPADPLYILREIDEPMGFAALFRILKGVGDQNQAPILEPFPSDANQWVRHFAKQSYPNFLRGTPNQCRITY
jgi:hypothetical protein